jgi:hypothetical protein
MNRLLNLALLVSITCLTLFFNGCSTTTETARLGGIVYPASYYDCGWGPKNDHMMCFYKQRIAKDSPEFGKIILAGIMLAYDQLSSDDKQQGAQQPLLLSVIFNYTDGSAMAWFIPASDVKKFLEEQGITAKGLVPTDVTQSEFTEFMHKIKGVELPPMTGTAGKQAR